MISLSIYTPLCKLSAVLQNPCCTFWSSASLWRDLWSFLCWYFCANPCLPSTEENQKICQTCWSQLNHSDLLKEKKNSWLYTTLNGLLEVQKKIACSNLRQQILFNNHCLRMQVGYLSSLICEIWKVLNLYNIEWTYTIKIVEFQPQWFHSNSF